MNSKPRHRHHPLYIIAYALGRFVCLPILCFIICGGGICAIITTAGLIYSLIDEI